MSSNSKKHREVSGIGHFFLSILRFFVSVSRTHAKQSRWAVVIVLTILLLSGELFQKTGLIALMIIIPSDLLLYYLEKVLDKHD